MKKINKVLVAVSCFLFSTITMVQAAEVKDNYMVRAGAANLQTNKDGTITIKLHNVGKTVTAFPKTHNGDAPDSPEPMEATKFVGLWTGSFKQNPPNAAFFYTHQGKRQNGIVTITDATTTKVGKTTTLDLTVKPLTSGIIPEGFTSVDVTDPALVVDYGENNSAW